MREIERDVSTDSGNCITFKRKEGAYIQLKDFVYITLADDGLCRTDNVGKVEGRQKLYLTNDCMYKREIKSLLLVTLGLYHEHQRPDRDQYIQVHMDNVQNKAKKSFVKIKSNDTNLLDFPYDFHSVTHFSEYEYAKNPSFPTISTNVSGISFDNRSRLSFYDVLKVQTLYECTKGYTMLRDSTKYFQQKSTDIFYPQWRDTSERLPDYMTAKCNKTNDVYTLTVLNGATWTSEYPLPPGNYCISADICIGSSSSDIKSYIQLTEEPDSYRFNNTQRSGQWKTLNMTYTSENDWNLVLKGHILWGGDVLALDNLTVRRSVDVDCKM
ncbi:zinc metalloproteinase nas-7-like isoform X2 [Pecten maximus]|uniref:zinc metalloproteinase nas-7-like isoform X2 n=1 Tax=Pecten maximus TaxID=6579 RepID=UPI0014590FD0|nr:zinc metalloproteinase nas-7-like isoform X2 [Pecten maximus]